MFLNIHSKNLDMGKNLLRITGKLGTLDLQPGNRVHLISLWLIWGNIS